MMNNPPPPPLSTSASNEEKKESEHHVSVEGEDNEDEESQEENDDHENEILAADHNDYYHRPSTIDELSSTSFSNQRPTISSQHNHLPHSPPPGPSFSASALENNISIFGMEYIYDLKDSFILSNHDHFPIESQNKNKSPTTKELIFKEMKKLYHIINEFLSTEITYVHDLSILSLFLHDCYYCTISSVKSFVDSKAFGGFYVASDNISCMNSQFLSQLRSITQPLYTINDGTNHDQYFTVILTLIEQLTNLLSQYSTLFIQYKHFITFHHPISLLFSSYYAEDQDFHSYIDSQQANYSESFLSLSIKPVQRLPRYILLCKEMHNTIHKLLQYYTQDSNDYKLLHAARNSTYNVHTMISNCTLLCNNTMKDYEDLQKLHSIHQRLYGQNKNKPIPYPVVMKGRIHILEGELLRQHRRGGNTSHIAFLFNDIMMICTPTGYRSGIKLEITIPLYKNSNTLCLSIPPLVLLPSNNTSVEESSLWFILRAKKTMYFMAKTYAEKVKWVHTIQTILLQNVQFDPMFSYNRTALANTLIDEYNRYHSGERDPVRRTPSKTIDETNKLLQSTMKGTTTTATTTTSRTASIHTQVNWWKLLPELISYSQQQQQQQQQNDSPSSPGHPSSAITISQSISHLVSVIQVHQEEVIDSILSLIEEKNLTNLTSFLTLNKCQHYPITSDWFYEGNLKMLSFSNSDILRPIVLRIFLFHDLLIVTRVPLKEGKLQYYYHIKIQDLQVLDYLDTIPSSSSYKNSNDSHSPHSPHHSSSSSTLSSSTITTTDQMNFLNKPKTLALKLIDHSVKIKGFLSSLWSSSNTRERLLFATTLEQKESWYELFNETIQSYHKNTSPYYDHNTSLTPPPSSSSLSSHSREEGGEITSSPMETTPKLLIRRISSHGIGAWKYDDREIETEKNNETLL